MTLYDAPFPSNPLDIWLRDEGGLGGAWSARRVTAGPPGDPVGRTGPTARGGLLLLLRDSSRRETTPPLVAWRAIPFTGLGSAEWADAARCDAASQGRPQIAASRSGHSPTPLPFSQRPDGPAEPASVVNALACLDQIGSRGSRKPDSVQRRDAPAI